MGLLSYKINAEHVIERLNSLLEGEASDRIFASFVLPSDAMKDFKKQYIDLKEAIKKLPPLPKECQDNDETKKIDLGIKGSVTLELDKKDEKPKKD